MPPKHPTSSRRRANNKSNGKPSTQVEQQSQQSHHHHHDQLHNTDRPCCQKLRNIAERIFGNNSNNNNHHVENEPENDAFAILMRDYLLISSSTRTTTSATTRTSTVPNNNNNNSSLLSAKKKKRKKKKKKSNDEVMAPQDDAPNHVDDDALLDDPLLNPETTSETAAVLIITDQEQQPHPLVPDGFCLPRERLATLWNDHLLRTTSDETALQRTRQLLLETVQSHFSKNDSVFLPQHAVDAIAIPVMKQEMMERRLDRVVATFWSEQCSVSPSPRAGTAGQELTDFLTHVMSNDDTTTATTAATTTTTASLNNNNNNDPFFVPLQVIENALSDIVCTTCRRDAYLVLQQMSRKRVFELNGATFETVLDEYNNKNNDNGSSCNDYETESMYQMIMEEGGLPSSNGRLVPRWRFVAVDHLQNETDETSSRGWKLTRPQEQEQQHGKKAWSASDLDFLIKHYLLIMGLPAERLFRRQASSSTSRQNENVQIDIITDDADDTVQGLLATMDKIEDWICKAKAMLDAGRPLPTDDLIDLERFDHLKQADETCDSVFHDLLTMAIRITNAVNFVQAQYGRDPAKDPFEVQADVYWATRQCYLMWQVVLDGLAEVLRNLNDYEEARFATADRQGGLEEMYVSARARRDYYTFVHQKVVGCTELATRMFGERLRHPTPMGNNAGYPGTSMRFMTRLFMEEKFFRVQLSTQQFRDPHQDINRAFEDVMTVLRELAETVHGPNIERIVDESMIRWSKFWRVAGGIVECIKDRRESTAANGYSNDQYEKQIHDVHHQIVHILKVGQEEGEEDSDDASIKVIAWRRHTCSYIKQLAESWSSLATFAYSSNCLDAALGMSRSTIELLRKASKFEASPLRHGSCMGGDGTSRVASCLLAATFDSVAKRFEEYQSHTAMQQLLVDDIDSKATPKKSGAKKKKKKTIGSEQNENVSLNVGSAMKNGEVRNGEASHQPAVECESKTDLGNSAPDKNFEKSKVLLEASTLDSDSSCCVPEAQELIGHEADVPNDDGATDLSLYDDEIGVYDGSVFIRAETFLLKRLEALLMSGEKVVSVN